MKRRLYLIAELIAFIVIDAVLLAYTGLNPTEVQSASLIFINIIFIMALIAPFLVPKTANTYVYATTIYFIVVVGMIIELIIGIAFILSDWNDLLIACIVQGILVAAIVILLILQHAIDIPSADYENTARGYRADVMAETKSNMSDAFRHTKDADSRKIVEKTLDRVNSMPMKYKSETAEFDNMILELSRKILEQAKSDENAVLAESCGTMNALIDERNSEFRKHQN